MPLYAPVNNEDFLCKYLNIIADDCNVLVDILFKNVAKKNFTFLKLPDDQNWKIPLIYQLLDLRSYNFSVNDFNYDKFNDIICFYVLTNKRYSIFNYVPHLNYVFVLIYFTIFSCAKKTLIIIIMIIIQLLFHRRPRMND